GAAPERGDGPVRAPDRAPGPRTGGLEPHRGGPNSRGPSQFTAGEARPLGSPGADRRALSAQWLGAQPLGVPAQSLCDGTSSSRGSPRSEEHTSELQSRGHLVCRLLLEKKKKEAIRSRRLRMNEV